MRTTFQFVVCAGLLFSTSLNSCEFVEIEEPRTQLIKTTVFSSDATANAAIADIYYELSSNGFANGGTSSISFYCGLSSDELINYFSTGSSTGQEAQQINENVIAPNSSRILSLWSQMYKVIYKSNAVLEGLSASSSISAQLKDQLMGEAYFIRAFCFFYLVNLWGDVPITLSTDYQYNTRVPRMAKELVYEQIKSDLLQAQALLVYEYSFSKSERIRANKGAATALLARTYLYTGNWADAEEQASLVINNTTLYKLESIANVFLKNNSEAILQLSNDFGNTNDAKTFLITTAPNYCAMRNSFASGFEQNDRRLTQWIGISSNGTNSFYFSNKYRSLVASPINEYSTLLRLIEQFLIRAEARAHLNNLEGALNDVNAVRRRAGLNDFQGLDAESILLSVEQERKVEFFCEWGHRWLDLKRTNKVDAVVGALKPTTWVPTASLYPIPEMQIANDPAMANSQNPGY
jgi:starch-binding outer membrane protein, SusD/RagB family